MALLSFQRPVHAACLKHVRTKAQVDWPILPDGKAIKIHPPLVVSASVSSGKSVMISELAAEVKRAANDRGNQCRVLVLQRQGELCSQNSEAAWSVGLQNSCYSASLGRKSTHYDVVFTTEGTCARALEKEFAKWFPHLILIDECHMVNFNEANTQFATILLHFYALNPNLRVVGYTGSPFRDTETIIGDFWRSYATIPEDDPLYPDGGIGNGEISTDFMMREGWVVPTIFGWPSDEHEDSYADEFAKLQTRAGSWEYSEAELDAATGDIEKLTRILAEVVARAQERGGVLIFGATHKHLRQIKAVMLALGVPADQIGAITDKTPDKERADILKRAKEGNCKYVLNVAVLTTGVNVPWWDTIVYLRPIGSLVLLIQSIGRVLRLLLEDGAPTMVEMDSMSADERLALIAASAKPNALVLDYAGVLDRLGALYENPILEKAQKEHATRKNELITCPVCATENSMFARRCIGVIGSVRCDWFWQSKVCPDCGTKNDIVARDCRNCGCQLIDPNAALTNKHYSDTELTPVVKRTIEAGKGGKLLVKYVLSDEREPYEIYYPNAGSSPQSIKVNTKIWWNMFVKPHIPAGKFRDSAYKMKADTAAKSAAIFNCPTHIAARWSEDSKKWTIGRRKFRQSGVFEGEDGDDQAL